MRNTPDWRQSHARFIRARADLLGAYREALVRGAPREAMIEDAAAVASALRQMPLLIVPEYPSNA